MALVTLAGMISVGKSTYAYELGKHLGYEVFYESVDDNPILDKFYEDPKRWSFSLQIYFLNNRFEAIKKALRKRNHILDRSIYEDELFTLINYEDGNMSKDEMEIYRSLLKNMMEELNQLEKKSPDLMIYLRANFDTILERLYKRGRTFEVGDKNLDYFRRLHSRYDDFIFNNYNASEVFVVDADRYDISIDSDKEIVMDMLKNKIDQIEKVR